jgi:YVTN family beta-propeller protein
MRVIRVLRACSRWQISLLACASRADAHRILFVRQRAWRVALTTAICIACKGNPSEEARQRAPGAPDAKQLLLLVSNEESNDVSVIDTASDTVLRSIPVGRRPRGLEVSPDGRKLYVALSGTPRGGPNVDERTLPPPDRTQDGIGVVDIESGTVLEKLPSGNDPEIVDSSPDGSLLAVANEDSAEMRLMTAHDARVIATPTVGLEPEGVRFRPDGRVIYVTSEGNDRIDVIDVDAGRAIATIPTGKRPRAVVFSADGARAYVTCELDARVDVLDAQAHRTLTSIEIEGTPKALPMGMALDGSADRLYVTLGRAGDVAVIDTSALRVVQRITGVGLRPWGIALTPAGDKVYTANGPSGDVSVIDTKSLQVLRRIPAGKLPWGLALVRVRGG